MLMRMNLKTSLMCLLVVAAITETCAGLNCYQCIGDDCADPFNTTSATVQTCPDADSKCSTVALGDSFIRTCLPAANCTANGCFSDTCAYCCDDNLCNGQSIAEGIGDMLQCYLCINSSDSSTTEGTGPCGDPFDPNDPEVWTVSCDGKCVTSNINLPFGGGRLIGRSCAPRANITEQCDTGCNDMVCTTCCSDNLCNGGPLPVPPTTEPNGACKTLQDKGLMLVVLLVILGCM